MTSAFPQPQSTLPCALSADVSSNDYLSLSTSPLLRAHILAALTTSLAIPGSGGLHLLVYDHANAALEACLAQTFRTPTAILFNSGLDANAGFFACILQLGDALIYDLAIHASVYDRARASRFRRPFTHNDVRVLRAESVAFRRV